MLRYAATMFDQVVITAANAAQARGYRLQTRGRRGYVVFPDPGGKRVGSLGATVNALRRTGFKASRRRKVLIVHSGGDARRTPGYAAMGKAFVPMRDARPMLDHIVEAMARLPLPEAGGVVVVSGDVLPRFDYEAVDLSRRGVTGVAYPDGADEARRHGVYMVEGRAVRGKAMAVSGFLQKPQVEGGRHLIDTGVMFIDGETAERMKSLPVAGDIYDEFPKMLLAGYAPFSVNVAGDDCDFFHVGSTRELLQKLGDGDTYVDAVGCPLHLAGENVVTNVPPGRFDSLTLAKGECFTCIPYGDGKWLDLKYRIDDNFKTDGLWERHGLGAIMKRIDYLRLLAVRECSARKTRTAPRQTFRVAAPVRIDFAGGWSDTPPICNDEGGTVFNAAVTLEGRKPIEVVVAPRRDRLVRVVSRDLGKRRLIRSAEELADHADPHDWCALVKSALAVTGFEFGSRGLDITISADLPKGSGMGTSSMLGAAVIAAILGRTDADEIGELTLRLEKEMRTGGGWQDQFGGIVGGVKLLSSQPGKRQRISVERLDSSWLAGLLRERGLLYFTGQKRMARNILRKVLAFYAENPHDFAKTLVRSLKADAAAAAAAVRRRDAAAFAAAINGYWRDKKLLDPGSTNDRVEELAARIGRHASAVTLTGAGGGGFMFILAKSRAAASRIRAELTGDAPTSTARFYDFDISEDGLSLEATP